MTAYAFAGATRESDGSKNSQSPPPPPPPACHEKGIGTKSRSHFWCTKEYIRDSCTKKKGEGEFLLLSIPWDSVLYYAGGAYVPGLHALCLRTCTASPPVYQVCNRVSCYPPSSQRKTGIMSISIPPCHFNAQRFFLSMQLPPTWLAFCQRQYSSLYLSSTHLKKIKRDE